MLAAGEPPRQQFAVATCQARVSSDAARVVKIFFRKIAAPAAPAPEPSTFVLATLGLLGLMGTRRRRNRG